MKKLTIPVNNKTFFTKYLLLFNEMFNLRPAALEVFSRLLYWNDKYRNVSKEDKDLLLFNKVTRSKILQDIDMSRASMDNQLTYLRKKGFLLGNSINPKYEIFYETHKDVLFSFRLKEDEND